MASISLKRSPFDEAVSNWAAQLEVQARKLCEACSEISNMVSRCERSLWPLSRYHEMMVCHGEVRKILAKADADRFRLKESIPVEALTKTFADLGFTPQGLDVEYFTPSPSLISIMLGMEIAQISLIRHMNSSEASPVAIEMRKIMQSEYALTNIMTESQSREKNELQLDSLRTMLDETGDMMRRNECLWFGAKWRLEMLYHKTIYSGTSNLNLKELADGWDLDHKRDMLASRVGSTADQIGQINAFIRGLRGPQNQATDMNTWLGGHSEEFHSVLGVLQAMVKDLMPSHIEFQSAAKECRRLADKMATDDHNLEQAIHQSRILSAEKEDLIARNIKLRTEIDRLKQKLLKPKTK